MLRNLIPLPFWPLSFFEGEGGGGGGTGATPGSGATPTPAATGTAAGATPAAGAGTSPAPATQPATGEEALGEPGKAVLREARRLAKEAEDRAKAAEQQLQELQAGQQTDHEKALTQARRESAAEERARWQEWGRDLVVEGALRGAGITSDKLLALAKAAPELRALKVDTETRRVEGLTEAVEALKKDPEYAALFGKQQTPTPAGPGGSWGGAEGGSNAAPVAPGADRLRRAYEASR
ncbi:MAG TPA: hypothetical protein VM305_08435 [Candidatus Limnocylindrales bacterium]|nr:hypothetical protein [Candidatus Limnocylindrales bacterium]